MIDLFRDIARAFVVVLLLGIAGAAAPTAPSPTWPIRVPRHKALYFDRSSSARANRDVDVNAETAIAGWQHELDRLESNLQKPRLQSVDPLAALMGAPSADDAER